MCILIPVQCFTHPKYNLLKGFILNRTSPFKDEDIEVEWQPKSQYWDRVEFEATPTQLPCSCSFSCNSLAPGWVDCLPEVLPQPPHTATVHQAYELSYMSSFPFCHFSLLKENKYFRIQLCGLLRLCQSWAATRQIRLLCFQKLCHGTVIKECLFGSRQ